MPAITAPMMRTSGTVQSAIRSNTFAVSLRTLGAYPSAPLSLRLQAFGVTIEV